MFRPLLELNNSLDTMRRGGGGVPIPPGLRAAQQEPPLEAASNSRKVTAELLGSPRPLTLPGAFQIIAEALLAGVEASDNLDLVGELTALKGRISARLDEQKSVRLAALQDQHAQAYEDCRRAVEQVSDCQRRASDCQMQMNQLPEPVVRARGFLREIQSARPDPRNYPSAAEVADWKKQLDAAQASADAVLGRQRQLEAQLVVEADRLSRAKRRLAELAAQECQLREQIAAGAPPVAITDMRRRMAEQAAE